MADYETKINKVENSIFAIGDGASAYGPIPVDPIYQETARRLTELVDLLSEYDNTTQDITEIRDLARDAQREVHSAQPDKQRIRRLLNSMQTVLQKAGAGLVGAGSLADAIAKIASAVQHL